MRIGHISDIHWCVTPKLSELSPKRFLGSANLFLRGRHRHFCRDVQSALIQHLEQLDLDLLICSGDLTAQSLKGEFALAKELLSPILESVPSFLIPGNHDVYTQRAFKHHRFEEYFASWMGEPYGSIRILSEQDVTVIGLHDSCPTWISAAGHIPMDQLNALEAFLDKEESSTAFLVLCLHYPIVHRRGEIFRSRSRGLRNIDALVQVLSKAKRKPDLILHGHEHHGYESTLDAGGVSIPIMDCGSSGYAFLPKQGRYAAMNVYEVNKSKHEATFRFQFTGSKFEQIGDISPYKEIV